MKKYLCHSLALLAMSAAAAVRYVDVNSASPTPLTGQPGTTAYADTNAVGPGQFFYRVGVQP